MTIPTVRFEALIERHHDEIYRYLWRLLNSAGRSDSEKDAQDLAQEVFLRAYQAQHPLSDEEIKAIPDLMRWRLLQPLIWKLNGSRPNRGTSKGYDLSLRRNWEMADRLKIHGNELQASLLSLKRD